MLATETGTKEQEYKLACDEVLLSRGKRNSSRTVVKSTNGSSYNFLKDLQRIKKALEAKKY